MTQAISDSFSSHEGATVDRRASELLGISAFVLAIALTVVVTFATGPSVTTTANALPHYAAVLACLAVLSVAAVGLLDHSRLRLERWKHPPILIISWFFLSVGCMGVIGLASPTRLAPLKALGVLDVTWAPAGMAMYALGFAVLVAVYHFAAPSLPVLPAALQLSRRVPKQHLLLILYGLTVLSRLVRIARGGVAFGATANPYGGLGGFNEWLQYFEDSHYLVIAYLAALGAKTRSARRTLIGVIAIEAGFVALSGFLKPALFLLLVIALASARSGGPLRLLGIRPMAAIALSVAASIGLFILIPVVEELRPMISAGLVNTKSVVDMERAVHTSYRAAWGHGFSNGTRLFRDKVYGRQAQVAQMPAIVLRSVPHDIPYRGLGQLALTPALAVPRVLWPTKPQLSNGTVISTELLHMPSGTTSSSTTTLLGDAYLFDGPLGVLVVAIAAGLLLGFLARNTVGIGWTPLYVALIPAMIDWENQFTTWFVGLIQITLVFGVLFLLVSERGMRKGASSVSLTR